MDDYQHNDLEVQKEFSASRFEDGNSAKMFFGLIFLCIALILGQGLFVFLFDNRSDLDRYNLIHHQEEYFTIYNQKANQYGIQRSLLDQLQTKHDAETIINQEVESVEHLIRMGFQMRPGYKTLHEDGVIVSNLQVNQAASSGQIYYDMEATNLFTPSMSQQSDYVGMYIKLYDYYVFEICGVYIYDDNRDLGQSVRDMNLRKDYYQANIHKIFALKDSKYMRYIVYPSKDFIPFSQNSDTGYVVSANINSFVVVEDFYYADKMEKEGENHAIRLGNILLKGNTIVYDGEIDPSSNYDIALEEDNSIYISYSLYCQMYVAGDNYRYFVSNKIYDESYPHDYYRQVIRSVPQNTITIRIGDRQTERSLSLSNLKIKGIIIDINDMHAQSQKRGILASKNVIDQIREFSYNNDAIVKTSSVSYLGGFTDSLYSNGYIASYSSSDVFEGTPLYGLEDLVNSDIVALGLGGGFLFFFFSGNGLLNTINKRKEEEKLRLGEQTVEDEDNRGIKRSNFILSLILSILVSCGATYILIMQWNILSTQHFADNVAMIHYRLLAMGIIAISALLLECVLLRSMIKTLKSKRIKETDDLFMR